MKTLLSLLSLLLFFSVVNAQVVVTEPELSEKQNDYYIQPTLRNGVGVKRSIPLSVLKDFASKTKLENITSKADLVKFSGNTAYFDGSTWELKSGNRQSNGGSHSGSIIRLNSSSYWERKVNVIRPSMFGVIGDNSTDDYQALQNMFNAVKNGDEIILDSVIYYISKPLLLAKNNIKIRGKATIRCQGTAEISGMNGVGGGIVVQGNNCNISEITITGFTTIQGSRDYEYGRLIRIIGNNNIVERCTFNGGNSGGVEITGNRNIVQNNAFNISNNHNGGGDYGSIHLTGSTVNTQILYNNIIGQYYAAISGYGTGVKDVIIRNNYCEGANPLGLNLSAGLFFLQGANQNLIVEYNTFKKMAAEGVGISSYTISNTKDITISKNEFIDCDYTGISIYRSSDNANSYNVSITENEFYSTSDTTDHFIYAEQLNNSKITGNIIKGFQNITGTYSNGINLAYSPTNNTVLANKISNVNKGILFADNKNGICYGNTVDMCTDGIIYYFCLRSSITNNNVSDCTNPYVAGASSSTAFVANNITTNFGVVTEQSPRLKMSDVASSVQSVGDVRYAQLSSANSLTQPLTLTTTSTSQYSNTSFFLSNTANAAANQSIAQFVQNNSIGGGGTGQYNIRHLNYNGGGTGYSILTYNMQDVNSDLIVSAPRDISISSNRDFSIGYKSFAKFAYNGTEIGRFSTSSLLLGTSTESSSAILKLSSTTKGFLMPVMTSNEKNAIVSPATGLMVFDSTLLKFSYWNGQSWKNLTTD